jgi:hypothetical protein
MVEPAIHRFGMAGFEKPLQGDPVGRLPIGDFQERRRPLAQVSAFIAVADLFQSSALLGCEFEGAPR